MEHAEYQGSPRLHGSTLVFLPGDLNVARRDVGLTLQEVSSKPGLEVVTMPYVPPVLMFGTIAGMCSNVAEMVEEVDEFSNSAQSKQPNP